MPSLFLYICHFPYLQVIFLVKLFYFSVVLDTNQWYHSTKIVPTGELSITIGAEYD